jgi:tryptophan synthase beta chain
MVTRFQSVISEEIRVQLDEAIGRSYPDYLVACVGGGSNAAGAYYHYLEDERVRLISAEAAGLGIHSGKTAATSLLGSPGIIHGSRTLLMQDDDGQIKEPYSISAGLDYPGVGPLHAELAETGRASVYALSDEEALKAALLCTRLEGIIPALETAHALAALEKISPGPDQVVVINLSGRGDKDMETYINKLGI